MSKRILRGVAVLGLVSLLAAPSRGSIITVSTDQTGANTQIDVNHSAMFNFTVLSGQNVTQATGDFTVKRGSQTEQAITLSLFRGSDASGVLLKSVSLSAESISQSFGSELFVLRGLNLGAGDYSLKLTSNTSDRGSRQYFYKGGNLLVTPTAVATPTGTPPPLSLAAAVPEPTNLLSASLACVGTLVFALRNRRRPA